MVWCGIIFSGGILLGIEYAESRRVSAILIYFSLSILFLFLFIKFGKASRITFGVCIALIGVYLGARTMMPEFSKRNVYSYIGQKDIAIKGKINEMPRRYPSKTYLFVDVESVYSDNQWMPSEGKVRVAVANNCPLMYFGDEAIIETKLKAPGKYSNPGAFDYRKYLAAQGVYVTGYVFNGAGIKITRYRGWGVRRWIQNLREKFSRRVVGIGSNSPASDVLRALVIGDRWAVSKRLNDNYSRAGVAHILSVSGLHLSIIAMLFYTVIFWLLKRSEKLMLTIEVKRVAAILALIPMAVYTELAGAETPALRSAIMVAVLLTAWAINRLSDLPSSIAGAAIAILVIWPGALIEAEFILSFAAVIVIASIIPTMQFRFPIPDRLKGISYLQKFKRSIIFIILVGTAIFFAITPIISSMFHNLQYLSPFTNLIFIPIFGYVILPIGLAAVFFYPLFTPLCDLLIKIDLRIIEWANDLVDWFAGFPGTNLPIPYLDTIQIALIFILVIAVIKALGPRENYCKLYKIVSAAILCALVIYSSVVNILARHKGLEVVFLDAGLGSATVISSASGHTILIDAGGKSGEFSAGEMIIDPFLRYKNIRNIDVIIISHPHNNNVGGLEWIIDNIPVGEIWMADADYPEEYADRIIVAAQQYEIPVRKLSVERADIKFDELMVETLWPPNGYKPEKASIDAGSLVLKINNSYSSMLLMGGAKENIQDQILKGAKPLKSDVMSVADIDEENSISPAFVKMAQPYIAITGGAASGRTTLRDDDNLKNLRRYGVEIFNLHIDGAIRIRYADSDAAVSRWNGKKWQTIENLELSR